MKLIILALCFSVFSFAGGTCSKDTKLLLSCVSQDGSQYDVCKVKRKNLYHVRVNGELYSSNAEGGKLLDLALILEGTNYAGTSFIWEQVGQNTVRLTEVDEFEMPLDEPLSLKCTKR